MQNNKITLVTPKGEALYPCLKRTEQFQGTDTGKYTVQLKMSKADTDKMIERLEQVWEQISNQGEMATKRFAKNSMPKLGYRETDNGDIIFKFKTNAIIKTKSGDVLEKTVPIFDAKKNEIQEDIGMGSIVKVAADIAPYYVASNNYGLALYLKGVQVIDYKAPSTSGSAESMGFEEEEGFTEVGNDVVDNPFLPEGAEF
jgi:hypothetical protein